MYRLTTTPTMRERAPERSPAVIEVAQFPRPTPGEEVIHLLLRCLRDMQLCTELQVPSMRLFSAHILHAGFLVFKDVEDFALHCSPLEFVAWKRCVEFLFPGCLWSTHTEAGCGE